MPWRRTEPMEQRIEFALGALRTHNFRALCQEYGISTKTGYKWQKRLLEEGYGAMGERTRRPRKHPKQLGEEALCEIIRLKHAHPRWGARELKFGRPGAGRRY